MNWDWEKLQQQKRRQTGGGGGPQGPDFGQMGDQLKRFRQFRIPGGGKLVIGLVVLLWLASGIFIVQPDEMGVVMRFGAYDREAPPGPHYHLPFPIESALTPRVTEVRRVEVGFRSTSRTGEFEQGQYRDVPDESLMLTGDENIVDVQFIVQYQISDAKNYLFNVAGQPETIKHAAEAAMREVIGENKIDSALTGGKVEIQNDSRRLLQDIIDRYEMGLTVSAVQLQDVHPPDEVIDAFKDVASAREDRARFINEAEAYRNGVIPKARGQAAVVTNRAEAYREQTILQARGEASRFTTVLKEYQKAPDVTRQRLYIEAMEDVLSSEGVEVVVLPEATAGRTVPWMQLAPGAQGGGK